MSAPNDDGLIVAPLSGECAVECYVCAGYGCECCGGAGQIRVDLSQMNDDGGGL